MNYNIKGLILAIFLSMVLLNSKYLTSFKMIKDTNINTNEIKIASIAKQNPTVNKSQLQEKEIQKTDNQNNLQHTTLNKDLSEETKVKESKDENSSNEPSKSKEINSSKELSEKTLSRGGNIDEELYITLTFYTSLPEENGGFNNLNCSGKRLIPGTVANNVLPLGTEIYTKQFGTLTVEDTGGSDFDTIHRLDVYVPRNEGESIDHYKERVQDMGRVKVKARIIS